MKFWLRVVGCCGHREEKTEGKREKKRKKKGKSTCNEHMACNPHFREKAAVLCTESLKVVVDAKKRRKPSERYKEAPSVHSGSQIPFRGKAAGLCAKIKITFGSLHPCVVEPVHVLLKEAVAFLNCGVEWFLPGGNRKWGQYQRLSVIPMPSLTVSWN